MNHSGFKCLHNGRNIFPCSFWTDVKSNEWMSSAFLTWEDRAYAASTGAPLTRWLTRCEPSIYGDEWRTPKRGEGQAASLWSNETGSSRYSRRPFGVFYSHVITPNSKSDTCETCLHLWCWKWRSEKCRRDAQTLKDDL